MGRNRISRREFLYTGAAAAAGTALAACQPQTIIVETEKEVTKVVEKEVEKVVKETVVVEKEVEKEVTKVVEKEKIVEKEVEKVVTATPVPPANQASALERMVEAGQIPPLEERLPSNPFVAEGLDGIGNYGGMWRMGKSGQFDHTARNQVTNRGLLNIDHTLAITNYLAESWDVSPDGRVWTFNLRKGLKWSNGDVLTSEDFRFWYEDQVSNREYTTAHPTYLVSFVEGERVPAVFSAADAFTIQYEFAMPNALFNYNWIVIQGIGATPSDFMKPFHPDFGDKATIDKMVADAELDDWTQLYGQKDNKSVTVDRPVHEPWTVSNTWTNEVIWLDRNPYFWEIDTVGNQLPYIDRLQFREFRDRQIYVMWCVNGEIDCQGRHAGGFSDFTTLKEGEQGGDYTVQLWRATRVASIYFNQTTKNERLRELFEERDFRIAMSHACNRDEMRELLMDGLCTNMQYSPPEDSPLYYEPFAKSYLEYDPELSNGLLDGLGYTEKDSEGYRLFKDGSGDRISITALGGGTEPGDFMLMLIDYFKAVGIQLNYRGLDRALRVEMHQSNEVEMTAGEADRNLIPLADPQIWTKHININDRPWVNAYTAWYLDPSHPIAEEPPPDHYIWKIWGAWEEIQQTVDPEKQKELFWEILEVHRQELPMIGLYGDMPRLIIVKNGLKGIHAGHLWDCCRTLYEHIIDNATWYWDEPDKHT